MVEPGYAGKVLVAGTGRMAFDIGLFFLGRGATVHWLSRSEARAATARTELERLLRRRQLVEPDTTEADRVALGWLAAEGGPVWVRPVSGNHGSALRPDDGEAGAQVPPSPYDLVIESSVEDPAVKRELARALAPLGGPDTFWLGNSSSVMPDILGPDWLGCHFFHPVALHALVELVLPRGQAGLGAAQRNRLERTRALMELLGFRCLVQEPERAFAVNRLLLPLQIFALDCLRAGWPAATVDEASASPCLPLRHLGAMDAIGLELVCAAAANYRRGPAAVDPAGVDRLVAGLGELLALGKRGARNRDGLLMGQPLPWQLAELAGDVVALAARFAALAETTLRQALASGDFTRDELAFVLDELWGGRLP